MADHPPPPLLPLVVPQHYVWLYEGSQLGLKLAGVGMVVLMLAGVMFPLWPPFMRQGVWYLSIAVLGLIGLFILLAIVRLLFYLITLVVARPGIWIFPNLFEDVGFVDSFIPYWAWDVPPPPKGKKGKQQQQQQALTEGGDDAAQGESTAVSRPQQQQQQASTKSSSRQAVANLPGVSPAPPPELLGGGNAHQQAAGAPATPLTAQSGVTELTESSVPQTPATPAYEKLDELD